MKSSKQKFANRNVNLEHTSHMKSKIGTQLISIRFLYVICLIPNGKNFTLYTTLHVYVHVCAGTNRSLINNRDNLAEISAKC